MKYSMRTKLTASFAATALICVILIGLFSNIQLEKHFKEYVLQNQLKENQEMVDLIGSIAYQNGKWDIHKIENIGIFALKQGLILQIKDQNGEKIWDSFMTLSEDSQKNMQGINQNLMNQISDTKKEITKKTYPVLDENKVLGTVEITFYGSVNYNEIDIHFVRTLNMVFLFVGIFSLIMSMIVGVILSDRITRPIVRVIRKAQLIASGTYEERSVENSSTREISDLTQSINDLAITLEAQEKLRKRLTGDVAHELRTPMATLHSHMEAMIDGVWEPTVERLISCDEEINRIIRLVSDLEKLAHYESENLVLNKSSFKAKDFLEHLVKAFEAEFAKLGITPMIDCDESIFVADRDKLSQVFINLISNALKFTPSGGMIKISVKEDTHQIDIIVADNGQGISAQDLTHIFERFYRADVSRNRKTGGSGIGLSLVKAIVEAHGGTIIVSSEPGKGTQFTMHFPN